MSTSAHWHIVIKTLQIFSLIIIVNCSLFIVHCDAQHYELPPNRPLYDRHPYHFGFILGVNSMNYSIHNNQNLRQFDSLKIVQSTPQLGFTVGIVTSLRLGTDFADLRFLPSLSFGEARLIYVLSKSNTASLDTQTKPSEITNLEFPFVVKLKSQRFWNNVRAFVLGGIKYSIDMASQAKQRETSDVYVVRLKRSDYTYEVGTGFDFYFPYFKFGIDIKMDYGVRDLLKRDNTVYTNSITNLNSKVFLLSFTFE